MSSAIASNAHHLFPVGLVARPVSEGGQEVETWENRASVWGFREAGEERAGSGRNHATMLNNSHSKKGLREETKKNGVGAGNAR